MIDIVEILVHWYAGRSKNEMASSLGVDRKTIRKYLAPAEAAGWHLHKLDYPATRDELVEHARTECERVIATLSELPEREYRTPVAVNKAYGEITRKYVDASLGARAGPARAPRSTRDRNPRWLTGTEAADWKDPDLIMVPGPSRSAKGRSAARRMKPVKGPFQLLDGGGDGAHEFRAGAEFGRVEVDGGRGGGLRVAVDGFADAADERFSGGAEFSAQHDRRAIEAVADVGEHAPDGSPGVGDDAGGDGVAAPRSATTKRTVAAFTTRTSTVSALPRQSPPHCGETGGEPEDHEGVETAEFLTRVPNPASRRSGSGRGP